MTETTILAVDDDPDFLHAVRMMLETADFQVITACNGLDALQLLNRHPVDLILTDIAMPGMNGYQLFTRVAQSPHWAHIPFIFLSARDMDNDIQFGKELGVDDYLLKPVESADLLASVRGKLKRAQRWQRVQQAAATLLAAPAGTDRVHIGDLVISFDQYRVWMGDSRVHMSAREFKLLAHLVKQPGRAISHQTLILATHDLETDVQDASRLLRPLVRSLRRKLGYPAGDMGCIVNVRGVGYQFVYPQKEKSSLLP